MNIDTTVTGGRPCAQGLSPAVHPSSGYALGHQTPWPLKSTGMRKLPACAVNLRRDENNIAHPSQMGARGGAGGDRIPAAQAGPGSIPADLAVTGAERV